MMIYKTQLKIEELCFHHFMNYGPLVGSSYVTQSIHALPQQCTQTNNRRLNT